jgi:hypothetical protein
MGYTDVYCWHVSKQIMDEYFFIKFNSLIKEDATSFTYLNDLFITEKLYILSQKPVTYKTSFNKEENDNIISNTIEILCDKLGINEYEQYDEYGIDWTTFIEIILHYSNIILDKQITQINKQINKDYTCEKCDTPYDDITECNECPCKKCKNCNIFYNYVTTTIEGIPIEHDYCHDCNCNLY